MYCGWTNNIKSREQTHNLGKGSKYVRSRGGGKIIYFEKFKTKSKALKREIEVKKWPRKQKLKLLNLTKKKPVVYTA